MHMKQNKKILIIAATMLVLIVTTAVAYAASTPGSESDPVVTKSYVDQAVAKAAGTTYQVVHMEAGQTLLGGEGTEIILRSGIATAIDNGANGLSDMTAAAELCTGDDVGINHLILVPRNDGRGIRVSDESYLMVRGTYTIK